MYLKKIMTCQTYFQVSRYDGSGEATICQKIPEKES